MEIISFIGYGIIGLATTIIVFKIKKNKAKKHITELGYNIIEEENIESIYIACIENKLKSIFFIKIYEAISPIYDAVNDFKGFKNPKALVTLNSEQFYIDNDGIRILN